jgi:hypothetical protein
LEEKTDSPADDRSPEERAKNRRHPAPAFGRSRFLWSLFPELSGIRTYPVRGYFGKL